MRTHTGALAPVSTHTVRSVHGARCCSWAISSLHSRFLWWTVPGLSLTTDETLWWGVLRAGGLKKWLLCLQHTRQESGVIVTRGTKLVAFL